MSEKWLLTDILKIANKNLKWRLRNIILKKLMKSNNSPCRNDNSCSFVFLRDSNTFVYFFSGLQVSGTRDQIWNPSGSYFRYFFVFPLPNVLQVLLCLEGNFELSHCIRSQCFKMWNQSPYNECGLLVWIYSLLQKYDCFLVLLPLTRLLHRLDSNQGTGSIAND